MSRAVGAGVSDQMVYAPGRRPEVVLNAVDDDVKNFLSEVDGWFRDPTYFATRVREETATIVRYRTQCLSDLGSGYGDDLDDVCFRIPIVDTRQSRSRPISAPRRAPSPDSSTWTKDESIPM